MQILCLLSVIDCISYKVQVLPIDEVGSMVGKLVAIDR